MDLSQTKLTKNEWTSIETPVSDDEKKVLRLIMDGWTQPDICRNDTQSILAHLKIDTSPEMDMYLFKTQFEPAILAMITPPVRPVASGSKKSASASASLSLMFAPLPTYVSPIRQWLDSMKKGKTKQPNSRDIIRIQNTSNTIQTNKHAIFEFVLLDFVKSLVFPETTTDQSRAGFFAYSLIQFRKSTVPKVNALILELVDIVLRVYGPKSPASVRAVFENAQEYIERNTYLIKYEDMKLYPHQQELFRLFGSGARRSRATPRLVLYMAPTGTGKTLSPLGLSQGYRIIFVCVARHVGLALAKSAYSMEKRVAFAFGCETASDIRLHYFAAVDYKINKRSGGIGKVDNSNGSKVEIMICDVASYLTAMHYMLAFNDEQDIITYWDEPTITMDYPEHALHETIHRNWKHNKISKMVLSCATLPKHTEIASVFEDFKQRFTVVDEDDNEVVPEWSIIDSYDCKKSISLLNKDGKAMLPHLLFPKYKDLLKCVEHCENNKTLLRYFDVGEIVRFVCRVSEWKYVSEEMAIEKQFGSISDIHMRSLKNYYLSFLSAIDSSKWPEIYTYFAEQTQSKLFLQREPLELGGGVGGGASNLRKIQSCDASSTGSSASTAPAIRRIHSTSVVERPERLYSAGVLVSTGDAYTLTDGPTIFLAEDVDKIGLFYIQQTKIPDSVLTAVLAKIEKNNEIQRALSHLQKEIDDKTASASGSSGDGGEKTKKMERDPALNREVARLMDRLDALKSQIENVSLNPKYIPNTSQHQDTWVPPGYEKPTNAFVPNVDQEDVKEIMSLEVDNQKKLMLILGIGVFDLSVSVEYLEVMKRLAQTKRLFLIIATSDYIYGTNYQFSHGFIGKDLQNMTQQKIIQAIGRIGRNNIQQDYTVRFRENDILMRLFQPMESNLEAVVMCRLFSGGGCEEEE